VLIKVACIYVNKSFERVSFNASSDSSVEDAAARVVVDLVLQSRRVAILRQFEVSPVRLSILISMILSTAHQIDLELYKLTYYSDLEFNDDDE